MATASMVFRANPRLLLQLHVKHRAGFPLFTGESILHVCCVNLHEGLLCELIDLLSGTGAGPRTQVGSGKWAMEPSPVARARARPRTCICMCICTCDHREEHRYSHHELDDVLGLEPTTSVRALFSPLFSPPLADQPRDRATTVGRRHQ